MDVHVFSGDPDIDFKDLYSSHILARKRENISFCNEHGHICYFYGGAFFCKNCGSGINDFVVSLMQYTGIHLPQDQTSKFEKGVLSQYSQTEKNKVDFLKIQLQVLGEKILRNNKGLDFRILCNSKKMGLAYGLFSVETPFVVASAYLKENPKIDYCMIMQKRLAKDIAPILKFGGRTYIEVFDG